MKRLALALLFGLALILTATLIANAQETGEATVIEVGTPTLTGIALLFAPLAAAATGVERTLEMFWNWYETLFLNLVSLIAKGREWTRWAHDEIDSANQAVNYLARDLARLRRGGTAGAVGQERGESALLRAMRDAEAELLSAETRLRSVLKNSRYRQIKGAVSVLAGIAMGVLIAALAKLQMFTLLGVPGVPAGIDMLITGLVVGTGSAPVHSLIGILQSSKDTLEDTSRLLQGRYELTVNEARQPDLTAMRTSAGDLSSDYKLYLSKPSV